MNKENKVKRGREQNWSADEKEMLRQLVQEYIEVVEDRGNDTQMIRKKVVAWEKIASGMVSMGYERSVDKLRQQWTRMKVSAKQAKAATKKAIKATGNEMIVPKTEETDLLVQGMIADQLVEDTICIDSNSALPPTASCVRPLTSPNENLSDYIAYSPEPSAISQAEEVIDNSLLLIENDNATAPEPAIRTPKPAMQKPSVPSASSNLLGALKKLPKKPTTKGDVMAERRIQIKKEISRSDELHALQVALAKELLLQAREATAHARKIHALEIKTMSDV